MHFKLVVGPMTRRHPELTEALEGIGQDNVYVRRKLAEGP